MKVTEFQGSSLVQDPLSKALEGALVQVKYSDIFVVIDTVSL